MNMFYASKTFYINMFCARLKDCLKGSKKGRGRRKVDRKGQHLAAMEKITKVAIQRSNISLASPLQK